MNPASNSFSTVDRLEACGGVLLNGNWFAVTCFEVITSILLL